MKSKSDQIILSVETGISGGSVSVLKNVEEIGFWIGNNKVSRSEDVLQAISDIFEENNIKKSEVAHIITSVEPGSFTGLRIGMSIVLGLTSAFQINFSKISVFEVLRSLSTRMGRTENLVTVVSVGRNFAWKSFNSHSDSDISVGTSANFTEFVRQNKENNFVVDQRVFDEFFQIERETVNVLNVGVNMALLIARFFMETGASDNVPSTDN